MPKLSIIIPHYNNPQGLNNLLDSIPDNPLIQVIVIDDRSNKEIDLYNELKLKKEKDNTLFISNDFKTKGAGSCRNIGLEHANGEWILFADSDDFFVDGFIEIVSKYLESDNDVVFFEPTSLDLQTNTISDRHINYARLIRQFKENPSKKHELLLRYKFFVPWSKLIRKKLLDSNNILFEEILASNDILFSGKVGFYMQKYEVSRETIYCVTKRPGSLTSSYSESIYEARVGAFIKYHKFLYDNLSREDMKYVDFTGLPLLFSTLTNGYGIKKTYEYYCRIKNSTMKIVNYKILNPITVSCKIAAQLKNFVNRKRYYKYYKIVDK